MLGYSRVRVNITALVRDGNDSDVAPDDQALSGRISLVPMVKSGTPLQYDDAGRKKLKVLTTIGPVELGPMGDIVNGPLDYVTVPAPDSSNTNLASLQWRADFLDTKYGTTAAPINSIFFYAVPGGDIDLAEELNTAPSSTAVQITRGPRGYGVVDVQTAGDELVFYAGPQDDPDAWLEAGRTPAPTATVSNSTIAAAVVTGPTKTALDQSYVPVPGSAGTTGQVLAKTSTGTAWIAPPTGGGGSSSGIAPDPADSEVLVFTAGSGGNVNPDPSDSDVLVLA